MPYVIGSAEVELVPSARGFDERADEAIGDLKIDVQLDPDIAGLKARLAAITDVHVGVDLDDTMAKARLEELTAPRVAPVIAEQTPTAGTGGGAGTDPLLGAIGGLGTMPALVTGVGLLIAALVPVAAVAGAATIGLAGLLAVAAGGAGIFGVMAIAAWALNDSFKTALGPSLDSLKGAFDSLIQANMGAILAPLQDGMQLLASVMPQLSPIIQAVSTALVGLITPLQAAVDSGAFSQFVAQITPLIGPAITGFATILENVAVGLGSMMGALAPFGQTVLTYLIQLTGQFANIGSSAGFQSFISYATAQLPVVADFIGNLVGAVGNLLAAFAPIGAVVLPILSGLIGFIAAIPTPVLTALVVVVLVLAAALAILVIVIGAMNIVGMIADSVFFPVIVTFLLIAAAVAVLIAIVVLVVMYWQNIVDFLTTVWAAVCSWFQDTLTNIGSWWNDVWGGISSFFTTVWNNIVSFFTTVWNGIVSGVTGFVNVLVGVFQSIVTFLTPVFNLIATVVRTYVTFWVDIFLIIAAVAVTVWNAVVGAVQWAVGIVSTAIQAALSFISGVWTTVWGAVSSFFTDIWNGIVSFVQPIIQSVVGFISDAVSLFVTGWNIEWQGISDFFTNIWNGIVSFVQPIIDGVVSFITDAISNLAAGWNIAWQGISDFFSGIWQGMQNAVQAAIDWIGSVMSGIQTTILQPLANAGTWLVDTGTNLIKGLWNGISDVMGWLQDQIVGAFNNVVDWAKGVLGIQSPSTVFAEIGGFMGQGMQIGLVDSIGTAMDAAQTQLVTRTSGLKASATAVMSAQLNAASLGGNENSKTLGQVRDYLSQLVDKTASARDIASATRMQARTGMV